MVEVDLASVVLFVISILLIMFIIYVAARLVTKEEIASGPYIARLFITALVIAILAPLLIGFLSDFLGLGTTGGLLGILISFIILAIILRYLVVSEVSLGSEWFEAFAIALLCIILLTIFNIAIGYLGQKPLFSLF
jgi:hypothetical protein